ncbi:MAG: rhodanese-like domain-containing protein [Acidobacteriota bacterium]
MTSSVRSTSEVRAALLNRDEIALLDVREEGPFAEAHPLFAASLPLGRIELEVYDRIPRRATPIVVYDAGEGLAGAAATKLRDLGYTDVAVLDGGLEGWRRAGGELFRDVNVPSKAFGELVEVTRHTPSLSAEDLQVLLDAHADLVVLDARRFEEYQTMSIPAAVSVPGAELVYRVGTIAADPDTLVVVNCAGRTRSIIGTQSLVNAGIPNRVAALRNGTIGWKLAGLTLEHGQGRRMPTVAAAQREHARAAARLVADRAGVGRLAGDLLSHWGSESTRTLYRFDVRTPEEFAAGHLHGFRSAPGGQLVHETDVFATVRGARIVLADDEGARASMTASWLAQMGWEVHVLAEGATPAALETGPWRPSMPSAPAVRTVEVNELDALIREKDAGQTDVVVLDFAPSVDYIRGHISGAWFTSRTLLRQPATVLPPAKRYVVTSPDGILARFAAADVEASTGVGTSVLAGGTDAWVVAGRPLEAIPLRLATPVLDIYKRPYEGVENSAVAMQAYLDWEFGLVAQLERDGTAQFRVL